MLPETESRISKLLLEIVRGENTIESCRRIMTNNYDFDAYQIFDYLDVENKNRIDSIDIINYLKYKELYITDIEAQLIILFYDQNFDGVLTFDEFKNLLLNTNAQSSKKTANNFLGKISSEVDDSLFNILKNEVRLVRNILSILEGLKKRNDFNIHSVYHLLRGDKCINKESIENYFIRKDIIFSEIDIISLRKRLDLNKDGKIDLNELHAFLGYPKCSICCLSSPCHICNIKDCSICFRDIPCFLHNRIHDDLYSRLRPEYKERNYYNFNPKKLTDNINNKEKIKVNDNNDVDKNNNKTTPQINNNFNFNYNGDGGDLNFAKTFSPQRKKISKNLILRSSPERKFNSNRLLSPDNKNINQKTKKNQIYKDVQRNKEINDYLYEKRREDEMIFLNYLKEAMLTEKKIEDKKLKLSLCNDFNCEDAFCLFEKNSKNFLEKEDLKEGLNLLNINPSKEEIDILMNKYSLKNNGILEFSDFFDIVVPFEKGYRNNVENRLPNSTYNSPSLEIFSENTGKELKELFYLIINEENKLNSMRKEFSQSLKNVNLERIFNEICSNDNKNFNEYDLLKYIKQKGIFVDENYCDLLFIRLDCNRNGTVEFWEIAKEFKSVF